MKKEEGQGKRRRLLLEGKSRVPGEINSGRGEENLEGLSWAEGKKNPSIKSQKPEPRRKS